MYSGKEFPTDFFFRLDMFVYDYTSFPVNYVPSGLFILVK